jgi:hypothetical protein
MAKRTAINLPRGTAIATTRAKLRDNTERIANDGMDSSRSQRGSISGTAERQGDWSRQTHMPNTPLKITTCTTTPEYGALHYDDVKENSLKHYIPDDFQNTIDRSDRVPSWNPMGTTRDAPDAFTRTDTGNQEHHGYRKSPNKMVMSVADNNSISNGHVTSVSQLQGRNNPVSTYTSGTIGRAPTERYGTRRNPYA